MIERDCNTCQHHVQGKSIDNAPTICWSCGPALSKWKPLIKEPSGFPIVAISGAAGAGKDTAAQCLIDRGYHRFSFAEPLKRALCAMLGWTMVQLEDRTFKEAVIPELGFSPRVAMQTLGTEWGRGLNSSLWLILAKQRLDRLIHSGQAKGIVVTDCRFPNEATWVREQGGKVFVVVREGVGNVPAHSSEDALPSDLVTHYLMNDRSVDELHASLLSLLKL